MKESRALFYTHATGAFIVELRGCGIEFPDNVKVLIDENGKPKEASPEEVQKWFHECIKDIPDKNIAKEIEISLNNEYKQLQKSPH